MDVRGPDGRVTKSTRQFGTAGQAGAYAKQRLVPFGEYVLLRPLLSWVGQRRRRGRPGAEPGPVLLRVASVEVGPLESQESAFPDLRRTRPA